MLYPPDGALCVHWTNIRMTSSSEVQGTLGTHQDSTYTGRLTAPSPAFFWVQSSAMQFKGRVLGIKCKRKGRCLAFCLTKGKLVRDRVLDLTCKGRCRCSAFGLAKGKLDNSRVLIIKRHMQGQAHGLWPYRMRAWQKQSAEIQMQRHRQMLGLWPHKGQA